MTRTVASPSGLRIEPPIQPGDDSAAVMRSRIVASHSDSEPSLTTTRVITDSMSSAPLVENADYAARRSARGLGGCPTRAQGRGPAPGGAVAARREQPVAESSVPLRSGSVMLAGLSIRLTLAAV